MFSWSSRVDVGQAIEVGVASKWVESGLREGVAVV